MEQWPWFERCTYIGKSFNMKSGETYSFIVAGEPTWLSENIRIIDQKRGYGYSMQLMSVVLAILMFITFYTTRERVLPPQRSRNHPNKILKICLAIDRGGIAYYGVISLLITPLNKVLSLSILPIIYTQLLASILSCRLNVSFYCRCNFNDTFK
jgi:Na+/melibiose symporter-like transporter